MDLKSLLKSAVIGSAFTLLAGAPMVAAAGPDPVMADEPIAAVSDADDLNEALDANNVDEGAQNDMNESANGDTNANDDSNDEAQSDSAVENDMEDSATDASQAQQDATEATQEDTSDDSSDTPPPG